MGRVPKDDSQKLPPLRPRNDSGAYIVWTMAPAHRDESCRWESVDGRWVTLTLGRGGMVGKVIVEDSGGRREVIDSYEDALKFARSLRD